MLHPRVGVVLWEHPANNMVCLQLRVLHPPQAQTQTQQNEKLLLVLHQIALIILTDEVEETLKISVTQLRFFVTCTKLKKEDKMV